VAEVARRGFQHPELVAAWLLLSMLVAFAAESLLTTARPALLERRR
jgi:hypothetical protein